MAEMDLYVARLEALRRVARDGSEYWKARDLQELLGYEEWRNFNAAIARAITSCESAGGVVSDHFVGTNNMMEIGKGAKRETDDWFLSRYACYLIAVNGATTKPEIAYAQAYFLVQARKQEQQEQLTEVERRALLRDRVRESNKKLGEAAKQANVQRYAVFHDAGYKKLYAGLGVREIKRHKGIPEKDDLLDCAGRAELALNEFRITQSEQKIVREGIKTEQHAIQAHEVVAAEVRNAIKKVGGTMPEDLPAEPNINKLVSPKRRKELRDGLGGDSAK
ncbi:MAG: DNA damage-inducible protein D [Acidobacteriota bacterium]|nr:DNA damage-inducible protein D [Acidobacteriota bacterium]